MNNSIAVPNQGPWPLAPYSPGQQPLQPGQRSYSAASILDLATFLRIIQHWRWLILGAVALGIAAAIIITLLTTPVYRAAVTLEVNPPTVPVTTNDRSNERESVQDPYDLVATQVGLLTSKSVAERTAQELNLGNNPDFVPQTGDASTRLRQATGAVQQGLKAEVPKEGQLIKFSFDSTSPQLAGLVA